MSDLSAMAVNEMMAMARENLHGMAESCILLAIAYPQTYLAVLFTLIVLLLKALCPPPSKPGLVRSIFRLLFCRGSHLPGQLTGLKFPINAAELTAERLTVLLQHGGHLGQGSQVVTVKDRLTEIRDGVKGDKAIIDVTYAYLGTGPVPDGLPTTFFVKFSIQKLSAMRLVCESSEVSACEANYYTHLAKASCACIPSPRCFFVDYNDISGEFILVQELMPFGERPGVAGSLLPLKHRIRDAPLLDEQRRFATLGASLNAAFWGTTALDLGCLRFDATHRRLWVIMQALSWLGLVHTTRKTLKGRKIPNSKGYVTWSPPPGLLGNESALIWDMPHIMTSLCEETGMTAFGHNDIVTDNAYFIAGPDGKSIASAGLVDWQQSSVNSVGQEWCVGHPRQRRIFDPAA